MTEKNQSQARTAFDALHRQQLEIIARIADVAAGLGKEEQAGIREHIKDITGKGSQKLRALADELNTLARDNHPPQSVSGNLKGANLNEAALGGANLLSANLHRADLSGATGEGGIKPGQTPQSPNQEKENGKPLSPRP